MGCQPPQQPVGSPTDSARGRIGCNSGLRKNSVSSCSAFETFSKPPPETGPPKVIRLRPAKEIDLLWCNTDKGDRGFFDPGPFPRVLFGASSAREHQHDDEAGADNCGLQIQRQREVGGSTEELKESAHPTIRFC